MSAFLLPERTAAVQTSTTTITYVPFSDWVPAESARVVKVRTIANSFAGAVKVTPAYQTASTDTDNPDAWAKLASGTSELTAAGQSCTGKVDLSTTLNTKMALRFGVAIELTSGSGWGQAICSLLVAGRCST